MPGDIRGAAGARWLAISLAAVLLAGCGGAAAPASAPASATAKPASSASAATAASSAASAKPAASASAKPAGSAAASAKPAASGSAAAKPAAGSAGIPVRFSYVSNASQAYVPLIMKSKGIDKKYGLDVQTNEVSAPPQQWLALRAGSGDISAGNVVDLFRERKAGMKAKAVRGFTGWGNEIVTVPSKPYSKLADLKGARFGTFSTTLMDWLVVRTAGKKAENIDLQTDAKVVNAAPALLNEQLFKDQIDAALQFAPDLTEAPEVEGKMKKITSVHDLLQEAGFDPDSFYLTWNLLDSWGEKNPGATPKLVAAMDEAVNVLETDDSVWPDLAKRSGVTDPKLLPDFIKLQRESFKTNFGEAKLKPTQDLFDAIAKALGTDALGQQNVDPAAFDFQSIVAAKALEK